MNPAFSPPINPHEQFTRFWTQAHPLVASYISSLVPDFSEAEDLLQNVAIRLHQKFSDYDPQRSFVSWAMGFARLEILNARRSHARSFMTYNSRLMESVAGLYEEMAPELSQRTMALRECLKKVEGRTRDILRLRYEESLKPNQIAERLSMEGVAIRVALSRLRNSLRECIQRKLGNTGEMA